VPSKLVVVPAVGLESTATFVPALKDAT